VGSALNGSREAKGIARQRSRSKRAGREVGLRRFPLPDLSLVAIESWRDYVTNM